VPTRGRFHNKPCHCSQTYSRIRRSPKTPLLHQNKSLSAVRHRYGSVFVRSEHLQDKIKFNPARGADKGAISPQTSPLPSGSFSYPSPTQDHVNPPRRVVIGRAAALRLCLRPCLTPASKNRVQPSSGCRQGGDFTSNLATALRLSLVPANHPRPRESTKTSRRQPCSSASALPSSMPDTCKQESGST
jgi:hypothetical protein